MHCINLNGTLISAITLFNILMEPTLTFEDVLNVFKGSPKLHLFDQNTAKTVIL